MGAKLIRRMLYGQRGVRVKGIQVQLYYNIVRSTNVRSHNLGVAWILAAAEGQMEGHCEGLTTNMVLTE